MRIAFQVLVIPFAIDSKRVDFALLRRKEGYWQFIAGGGEENETKIEAAKREAYEETGIHSEKVVELESISAIPKVHFMALKDRKDIYIIPEYSFAVQVVNRNLKISEEHIEYKWCSYEEAVNKLKYDSNKNALWELNERIKEGKIL